MRRAMAEASAEPLAGTLGNGLGDDDEDDDDASSAGPHGRGPRGALVVEDPPTPGDRPGEGSLNLDAFKDGNDVVHADAPSVSSSATPTPIGTPAGPTSSTPQRPKLGSRNNSYHGTDADGASPAPPPKSQHARYATTGTADTAAGARGRQSSLAPPTPRRDGTSPTRAGGMTESASLGNLAPPSGLGRLRKLSDAASPSRKSTADGERPSKKAATGPAAGIAGALAASGLAGMGVGNSSTLQQAASRASQSQSRRGSAVADNSFVGGMQGGVYRDPSTGALTERGAEPGTPGAGDEYAVRRGGHALRERSASSSVSLMSESSDASGLGAAANFSAAAAQHGLLAPPSNGAPTPNQLSPRSETGEPHLTPGGIGAVGGLSPAGLGEGVSLGDDDAWPGEGVGSQITGFAVASSRRNAEFHALFPSVPEDDYLIEDYGCALVKEILVQGRFYISENHVGFKANIFGWVTNVRGASLRQCVRASSLALDRLSCRSRRSCRLRSA
jgi:hypothetical protein